MPTDRAAARLRQLIKPPQNRNEMTILPTSLASRRLIDAIAGPPTST
jgi:hypothetical protein